MDARIFCLWRGAIFQRTTNKAVFFKRPGGDDVVYTWDQIPLYTRSRDDAAKGQPEDTLLVVNRQKQIGGQISLYARIGFQEAECTGDHAEARARCAANLRARAAMMENNTELTYIGLCLPLVTSTNYFKKE